MSQAALGRLAPIVERKQREAEGLQGQAESLWARAATAAPPRGLAAALRGGAVIAEMKRRSPSAGELRGGLDAAAAALGYERAGAAALSVLTDAVDFGGSLDDLAAARRVTALPLLRKDFVVDPVQVAQARVAGADAVLLIVAVLGATGLEAGLDAAARCDIDALVEVHDAEEARLARDHGALLIGVNNRDLRTLRTDLGTFARLRPLLGGAVCVAESGVRDAADAARLVAEGADAVLVGEALMRSPDAPAVCAAIVAACRGAAPRR